MKYMWALILPFIVLGIVLYLVVSNSNSPLMISDVYGTYKVTYKTRKTMSSQAKIVGIEVLEIKSDGTYSQTFTAGKSVQYHDGKWDIWQYPGNHKGHYSGNRLFVLYERAEFIDDRSTSINNTPLIRDFYATLSGRPPALSITIDDDVGCRYKKQPEK